MLHRSLACLAVSQLDFGEYWQRDDSGEYGWLPRGVYTLQVRAVDPAGNKDVAFVEGVNQYTCVCPLRFFLQVHCACIACIVEQNAIPYTVVRC